MSNGALLPDVDGKVIVMPLVCHSGVAYMLGTVGRVVEVKGDPTISVPTAQGDSAVWLAPEVGKKPAPFRKLTPLSCSDDVTVRLNVCEKLATLATTVIGPAAAPAVTVTDACPLALVVALDADSVPLPVRENWTVTLAVAGVTCTTSGWAKAAPTAAL